MCDMIHVILSVMIHIGASSAIKSVLTAIIRDAKDGIMVPIPQYPLYR